MNASEYQGFIPSEYSVEAEAAKFKETSYFFGPLANTMIKAVSNAFSLPIIVFSSALHYPVVYTTPRVCHVSIPLYVAFNQAGAGHYSALSFQCDEKEQPNSHHLPSTFAERVSADHSQAQSQSRCTCGHNLHPRDVFRCKRNTRLSYAVHAWQLTNLALLHVCASTAVTLMVSDQPKVVAPN